MHAWDEVKTVGLEGSVLGLGKIAKYRSRMEFNAWHVGLFTDSLERS